MYGSNATPGEHRPEPAQASEIHTSTYPDPLRIEAAILELPLEPPLFIVVRENRRHHTVSASTQFLSEIQDHNLRTARPLGLDHLRNDGVSHNIQSK